MGEDAPHGRRAPRAQPVAKRVKPADAPRRERPLDEQLNDAGQTEADAQGGSSLGVTDR